MPDLRRFPYTSRPEVEAMLDKHTEKCPLTTEQIPKRLRALELKFATLIGLMFGAGILGGVTAQALARLIP